MNKFILKNKFTILGIIFLLWIIFSFYLDFHSTMAYYQGQEVRVFRISNQKALIAPYHNNNNVVYTKTNEEQWVDLKDIKF